MPIERPPTALLVKTEHPGALIPGREFAGEFKGSVGASIVSNGYRPVVGAFAVQIGGQGREAAYNRPLFVEGGDRDIDARLRYARLGFCRKLESQGHQSPLSRVQIPVHKR